MKERDLQRKIVQHLGKMRSSGEPVYWLNIGGGPLIRKGTPDLLIVYRGVPYMIEIKRPGGKTTRLQERELMHWSFAGASVHVVESVEQLVGLIFEDRRG